MGRRAGGTGTVGDAVGPWLHCGTATVRRPEPQERLLPMPSLSLLSVVNVFPSASETFVARKLAALQEAGIDVSVAASSFGPAASATGLGLVPLTPWRDPRGAAAMLGGRGTAQALGALARSPWHRQPAGLRRRLLQAPLASAGADIIHFEFSGIAVSYLDVLESLRPARFVVSCRGSAEQLQPRVDPTRAVDLRRVFEAVDLIHCVSDAMADTVAHYGADAAKILVNRPAVPLDDLAPLAARRTAHDGPLRVLSIGRLQWVKGFDDGVRAVSVAARAGAAIDYRIVGEGPDRDKITFLIEEHGLHGAATLLGVRTPEEVRDQLLWADVLLLPSLSEGISNAVLEAMASGIPVVTTDCGGMEEVVTSGVDGFVVGVGDVASMAARLVELAADPGLRSALGARAATRAAASFGLERQITSFVAAYEALAGP